MKIYSTVFFLLFCCVLFGQSNLIQLDGAFEEWNDIATLERPQNNTFIRVKELSLTNDREFLYLRVKLDREYQFQEDPLLLWIDTDNNPSTGTPIRLIGADFFYHFGEKFGLFQGDTISQNSIDLIGMPTFSNDEFEFRIKRTLKPPSNEVIFPSPLVQVIIGTSSENNRLLPASGSYEYLFTGGPFDDYEGITLEKSNETDFRLVAYNILVDRPLDPSFRPRFQRVIEAIDADIYCFNEFFNASAEEVKVLMDQTVDAGNPGGWFVAKEDQDNVTVSRYPIIQAIQFYDFGNMTANLIDLPEDLGTQLLVINAHPVCCNLNEKRQLQMDAIAAFVEEAKNPGGRMTIEENTPIIIAGDLNLVGFQQQLTTVLEGDIVNTSTFGTAALPDWDDSPLADLIPLHTDQALATSWRNPASPFTPGRLDFILYSDSQIESLKSFILDTNNMPEDKREANGLLIGDTFFSDHLPLVSDFKLLNRTTSIDDPLDASIQLTIYPNPTQTKITLETNGIFQNLNYRILSANGVLLKGGILQSQRNILNVEEWNTGLYFLEYEVEGKRYQKSFIVK